MSCLHPLTQFRPGTHNGMMGLAAPQASEGLKQAGVCAMAQVMRASLEHFRTEGPCVCATTNIISLTDSALGPRQLASNSGTAPGGLFITRRALSFNGSLSAQVLSRLSSLRDAPEGSRFLLPCFSRSAGWL